jgi:hypothetical protein
MYDGKGLIVRIYFRAGTKRLFEKLRAFLRNHVEELRR